MAYQPNERWRVTEQATEVDDLLDGEAWAAADDGVMQEECGLVLVVLALRLVQLSMRWLRKPSMSIVFLHWSSSGMALAASNLAAPLLYWVNS